MASLKWGGAGAGVVIAVFLLLGLSPRAKPLGDDIGLLEAGDARVEGSAIRPYSATYTTQSRILGVPIGKGVIEVNVEVDSEELRLSYAFGSKFQDEMVLNRTDLRPLSRSFPGQAFDFQGSHVTAQLGSDGNQSSERTFDFPGSVFEVTVLDLVIAATENVLPLRVAWDNFQDEAGWIAHVREVSRETTLGPRNQEFQTRVIDIGFADGKVRRYWLAEIPPYKIRQRTFERGRSIVSSWDLVAFELR